MCQGGRGETTDDLGERGRCRAKAAGEANEEGRKQIRNNLVGVAEAKR